MFATSRSTRIAFLLSLSIALARCALAAAATDEDGVPAEVAALAPVLALHPDEAYNPMDPMEFIRLSRFRHHVGLGKDHGYNKRTGAWVRTNSRDPEYYDVPVAVVNSYGMHRSGKNRRPRDPNRGDDTVFLQPEGTPRGDETPNGSIPTFVHWERRGTVLMAQYWFFFGYNDAFGKVNHQGDWEVIAVHSANGTVTGAQFSSHGDKELVPASELRFSQGRVVGYCSRGSHAIYSSPAVRTVKVLQQDVASSGGTQWRTWLNLRVLEDQPWRDYAGAWGEVGNPVASMVAENATTGPLGPWHKLLPLGPSTPGHATITLFEDKGLGGRSIDVTSENVPDLKRYGGWDFGDRASSITWNIPAGWQVVLFKDDSYRHPQLRLDAGTGSISDLHGRGAGDSISSVAWLSTSRASDSPGRSTTPNGSDSSEGSVTLYQHHGFGGRSLSLRAGDDASDLKHHGFGDEASSIRHDVPDGWKVILYKDDSFRTPMFELTGRGTIHDLKDRGAGDAISSVRWLKTKTVSSETPDAPPSTPQIKTGPAAVPAPPPNSVAPEPVAPKIIEPSEPAPQAADLVAEFEKITYRDGRLAIKLRVKNAGPGAAPASRTRAYLSRNKKVDDRRDRKVGTARVPALQPSESVLVTLKNKVKKANAKGMRIIAVLDVDNEVEELEEANEFRAGKKLKAGSRKPGRKKKGGG